MKNILFVIGTRPEAIKLAPLVLEMKTRSGFNVKVCTTGQHKLMLQQVMDFFEIIPDEDLGLMRPDQSLFTLSSDAIRAMEKVYSSYAPHLVIVQGDTTTAFIGALTAYYARIKVAHVEAGLRSFDKDSPYPEEVNRKLIGVIADIHFAPTEKAVYNLANENIRKHVYNVGNTVIDALLNAIPKVEQMADINSSFPYLDSDKKIILITGHRRESFGEPFRNICNAIAHLAGAYKDIQFVYPVHLNPNVQKPVSEILEKIDNVHLIEPQDYAHMIWLMKKSQLILTDSGGVQEEAPSLGVPVLVMRDVTERTEGIEAGTALLVGTEQQNIVNEVDRLLNDKELYRKMSHAKNPYGDGSSCKQIADILTNIL